MLNFTKQEKYVLVVLSGVIFLGSLLKYCIKTYPHLHHVLESIEDDRFVHKIDVNAASYDQLIGVPYIGEFTAKKIVEYRLDKGVFKTLEEIKLIKGIHEKSFNVFIKYLKVKND
jgi:predicted DNA-binding helix-hairpin-helix protein